MVASRGFALVDAIVGTVILGAGLAVTIGLVGNAISSQQRGQDLATAAMLADEQLQLVLARGPDQYEQLFQTEGACDPPFEDFRYRVEFRGGATVGQTYEVAATITWQRGVTPQSVRIDTLVASREGTEESDPDPDRAPSETVTRELP